jgi:hypothetical protein
MEDTFTLIPLRIPSGWAILYNNGFFEEEMKVENGVIKNFLAYKEDILHISQIEYQEQKGYVLNSPTSYALDLGWYPDSDPNGEYKLTFLKSDWTNILYEYKSKDKNEIKGKIELLLQLANLNNESNLRNKISIDPRFK